MKVPGVNAPRAHLHLNGWRCKWDSGLIGSSQPNTFEGGQELTVTTFNKILNAILFLIQIQHLCD